MSSEGIVLPSYLFVSHLFCSLSGMKVPSWQCTSVVSASFVTAAHNTSRIFRFSSWWSSLVQPGLHLHYHILNHASNSFMSVCSWFSPQQVPPDLYHCVSFELNDWPKFLCQIQENSIFQESFFIQHIQENCIFLWLAGGKELNNLFSFILLIITHLFLNQWQIKTDCTSANPFWSLGVWISIPSEIK